MKLFTRKDAAPVRATHPMFEGTVFIERLTQDLSQQLDVAVVDFRDGAHNTFHTHTGDQILVITEGEGIVVSEAEEFTVSAGDIIFIPAGENHWHGARPGHSMVHLSIVASGK